MALTMLPTRRWVSNFSLFSSKFNNVLASSHFANSQSTITAPENENEYGETPEYPPCFDPSFHNLKRMKRQQWYDRIQALPTVEEKLFQLCITQRDGLPNKLPCVCPMRSFSVHYNTLPMKCFATRTHLKEGLPEVYSRMNVDALVEYLKPTILNAILNAFSGITVKAKHNNAELPDAVLYKKDCIRGQLISDHIIRAVSTLLSSHLPHLRNCQVDYNPRTDAFWWSWGFPPRKQVKIQRKAMKFGAVVPVDDPMDLCCQYNGDPYMQIRHAQPLPPFVDRDDPLCTTYNVPEYYYSHRTAGFQNGIRYPTSVPGFWPGDPCGFGSLSVFTAEQVKKACNILGEDSLPDILHSCGVLSSFGWLLALAYYKGFSPFQEITYPVTTQTVITNGQHWSFYAYQLNTICLSKDVNTNKYQNVCWGTNNLKLFDTVEDGEVKGYNDDVVKHFVKFLVNTPKEREGINLTPYLPETAVEQPDEYWAKMHAKWKVCYSNRTYTKIPPGPPLWEKIYKTKFNTRLD